MKLQVHFVLKGLMTPFREVIEVNPGYTDAEVRDHINETVIKGGLRVNGKVPAIQHIFFIKEL